MALREVAIAGVYASRQARMLEITPFDLILECLQGALADAGLQPGEVDGIAVEWPGPGAEVGDPASWATQLGTELSWVGDSIFLTAGIRGLIQAAAAVATGQADVVVMGGGLSGGPNQQRMRTVAPPERPFFDRFGGYVAPAFATLAQRHMYEFGTTSEQIASVAALIRNHGHRNPDAVMFGKGPYTIEDILASRPIASPLHLLEICLVAQGGAALVLTTVERARDLRQPPVAILGAGQEITGPLFLQAPTWREDGRLGAAAARRALGMAGLGIGDIDVFNLYDATAFEIIRQVELLGLCEAGEGGPFVASGAIAADGPHPVNLDGGCLSYAWNGVQQMTLKVVESVIQLRGQAGYRQVNDAETALSAVGGPGAQKFEVCVLGKV